MQEPLIPGLAAVMLGACLTGMSQVPFTHQTCSQCCLSLFPPPIHTLSLHAFSLHITCQCCSGCIQSICNMSLFIQVWRRAITLSWAAPTYTGVLLADMHCCFQTEQDAEVLDGIKSQIGISQYFGAIQDLKQTPQFIAGANGLQVARPATQAAASSGDAAGSPVSLPSQSIASLPALP